jgi:hypothetical protein
MLNLAILAWSAAWRTARAMPTVFGTTGAALACVALFALRQDGPTWWSALLLAATLILTQAILVRATLRYLMIADDEAAAALLPSPTLRDVALVTALTQIIAAGAPALMMASLQGLNHEIGPVSTMLSVPLLLPIMLLAMACALRLSVAAAPASLGLSAPLADAWDITEDNLPFMAGACTIALGPLLILALLGGLIFPSIGVVHALELTIIWLPLSGVQAGLVVGFYQRWQTLLRPDMRPCRNRSRRLEPLIRARRIQQ